MQEFTLYVLDDCRWQEIGIIEAMDVPDAYAVAALRMPAEHRGKPIALRLTDDAGDCEPQ